MKASHEITLVQTTVSSKKQARKLCRLVLRRRLGACLQLIPIESHYRWRGKTEKANEFLIIIKTRKRKAPELADFIKKNHPYELPEIVITPARADTAYAQWVNENTR
jgi:periplasmic divalent cation tolerance protein